MKACAYCKCQNCCPICDSHTVTPDSDPGSRFWIPAPAPDSCPELAGMTRGRPVGGLPESSTRFSNWTLFLVTALGRSTLSSLHVSFLVLILLFPDFARCITPVQDLPCRFGTSVPRRVARRAGRRAAHHPPHASPHHKEAKSHHDYHGDRDYPPPSHPTNETVVSPHLNHFLSGVQSVFL